MNPQQPGDEQLERALQSLPLQQPSEMLDRRVTQAMSSRRSPWRGLAAAACFGGLCFWAGMNVGGQETSTPDRSVGEPVGNLVELTPSDSQPRPTRIDAQWPVGHSQFIYTIDHGPPVRATIHDMIERTRWIDPENNRDIEVTRPVREVLLTRQQPY